MPHAFIWAMLAFLVFGALAFLAQASTACAKAWPSVRAAIGFVGGVVAFFAGKFFRSWAERRAVRKREALGLSFDPIRRLKR